MTSKAQRRKRKRITLPGGDTVPSRATGRDRSHTNQPPEDATATVVQARARHTGFAGRDTLIDAALGTPLGCCIAHLTQGDDRAQIINTWGALSASQARQIEILKGQKS